MTVFKIQYQRSHINIFTTLVSGTNVALQIQSYIAEIKMLNKSLTQQYLRLKANVSVMVAAFINLKLMLVT